ncbi:nitroreductase family deazaflavin-dependent oxidoreductase [Segniliparus rugosus]|uniref:Deazaflavin-dependent nitroreductase n=1 Tax=Segniliparus rugosus (strain ATCC BAA-974 / DSM 45345 / CCUG 50838 / CIP 108380 / JCM 13579 / CDC 945) TaxID=679197 RepID=E5XR15_SEGRC|nr:nitroreductase family deazaflavin-dependent oxidoreductase [Segniliparus rugosus]EFV13208.1 deazaflavin-dependent nitroreductase [Segniliparus rugosus ATCC BAA-974]
MTEHSEAQLRHTLPKGMKWYDPGATGLVNPGVLEEFQANGGKVGGRYAGMPLIVLHSVGAKSGEPRTNPLYHLDVDGRWFLVGSYGGSPKAPGWAHNLRANPKVRVDVPGEEGSVRSFEVTAQELAGAERERIWAVLVGRAPGFAEYQKSTSRVIPLFELVRGWQP